MGAIAPYLQLDASIKAKNESCPMIHFVHRDKTHSNLLTLFIFSYLLLRYLNPGNRLHK